MEIEEMKTIKTEIDIQAPAETVWEMLSDVDAFPSWNPFITRLEGELRVGGRLAVTIAPPGGRPMTFRPTVKTLVPGRELAWLGSLLIPGLFDGRHRFTIESIGGRHCALPSARGLHRDPRAAHGLRAQEDCRWLQGDELSVAPPAFARTTHCGRSHESQTGQTDQSGPDGL
jgi:hypothetical protein